MKALRLLVLLFLFVPLFANAHVPNQSYIFLRIYEKKGIDGTFEISLNEINKLYGTQFKKGATLEDLRPYLADLKAYLLKNSGFSSNYGEHPIALKDEVSLLKAGPRDYVQVHFTLKNTQRLPDELNVRYSAVFEKDDTHRGFLIVAYNWKAGIINNEANISLSFTPNDTEDVLSLTEASVWKGFVAMVKQGIWHIWIGIDHILFLLALILPSVVRRKKSHEKVTQQQGWSVGRTIWGWEPVQKFRPAFWYIVKVITFFTIAHTITLSLASLNIINLPSRLVESIIALSIGLAAYHNIKPIFKGRDWIIAFGFGLFHGFGFASVLSDLGLTGEFLSLSLLGFNVGVEIGQVAIIAMIFPVLYLIRKLKLYPKLLVFVSVFLILISLYWFVERAFDINLTLDEYLIREGYKIAVKLGLR